MRTSILALLLLFAADAFAQPVSGRLQLRTDFDLGAWELTAKQQLQSDLFAEVERDDPFDEIDYVGDFEDRDDDPDGDWDDSNDWEGGDTEGEGDDWDDDNGVRAPGANAEATPAYDRALFSDVRARTELELDRKLAGRFDWSTRLAHDLRPGANVTTLAMGLGYGHALTDRLDGDVQVRLQRQLARDGGWEARDQLRVGYDVTRDGRWLEPGVGIEAIYDGEDRAWERLRLDADLSVRVSSMHRLRGTYRLQRRIDRADTWEGAVRLTWQVRL